jgi:hypothetical protein
MKKMFCFLLGVGCYMPLLIAQKPGEPCCSVIGTDKASMIITIRDNYTGQVSQFKSSEKDFATLKSGSRVSSSFASKKITGINGLERVYDLIEPSYGEPCCGITGIQPDPIDPCCGVVSAKDAATGAVFQFKAPKEITAHLKAGDKVHRFFAAPPNEMVNSSLPPNEIANSLPPNEIVNPSLPPNEFAFIQLNINDAGMHASASSSSGKNVYAYPVIKNKKEDQNASDLWEIALPPNKTTASVFAGTNANGTTNAMTISSGDKLLIATHSYPVVLAPGIYNVSINNIPIKNVPLEKGKSTRIRVGYFVFSSSNWAIYNESGQQLYLSAGTGRFAIPIGNYQIRFGETKLQQSLKENEVVEF